MDTIDRAAADLPAEGASGLSARPRSDLAVSIVSPDGIIASCNAGCRRVTGFDAADVVGRHVSVLYPADAEVGLPIELLREAASQGTVERESWRLRKDGSRFLAHVTVDPIRDSAGEITGFADIARELTARRVSEEGLREDQEQFRLLVQGVTDYAIYLLDATGHVSNWNPGAQRIKGYLPDEIIGRHFSQFYTEEDRALDVPARALETARSEGRFEKEGWRLRKDGSRFWAHVLIDPIRGNDGELIGYAKVTRDITERRETQEQLERAREALLQSQKMEAVGQLTGGIAHDFNNLLMVILGSLELMRKRLPDDPRLGALLQNAVEGAERGAALTTRLLAFARRQDLKQEAVDLPVLVGGMRELMQRSLTPSISIETRFPPAISTVLADANQLELVLLNLVVNARDAMPEGGTIAVAAREEIIAADDVAGLKPGSYVRLTVADTGAGMDEATLRRAMEPFFTTKGPGKGTGLGLSVVSGIVEQFGGRFTLDSRLGQGTTATLWLPVVGSDEVVTEAAPEPPEQAQGQHRSLTVLAVDDDQLVLNNTIAMLEDLGHAGIGATSAADALTLLRRGVAVDVVVTDHAMPHMTGLEMSKAIRQIWPHLPIILATGFAEIEPGEDANLPKLAKPFTQDALAALLIRVIQPTGDALI